MRRNVNFFHSAASRPLDEIENAAVGSVLSRHTHRRHMANCGQCVPGNFAVFVNRNLTACHDAAPINRLPFLEGSLSILCRLVSIFLFRLGVLEKALADDVGLYIKGDHDGKQQSDTARLYDIMNVTVRTLQYYDKEASVFLGGPQASIPTRTSSVSIRF